MVKKTDNLSNGKFLVRYFPSGEVDKFTRFVDVNQGGIMPDTPPPDPTPFDKFRDLTRKLLAVPKSEIAAGEKKWKKKQARKKKK